MRDLVAISPVFRGSLCLLVRADGANKILLLEVVL